MRNFQPGFSFSSGTVPLRGLSGSLVLAAAALSVAATACGLRRRALFVAGGWEPRGLLFRRCVWSNELECDWPSCCDNTLAVYSVPESLHECNLSYSWTRSVHLDKVCRCLGLPRQYLHFAPVRVQLQGPLSSPIFSRFRRWLAYSWRRRGGRTLMEGVTNLCLQWSL